MSLHVKLSAIAARIAALEAERAELETRIATGYVDPDQVRVGRRVSFEFGRGADKKRVLEGVVIGRREGAGKAAPQVAVEVGEGFDKEVFKVHPNAVRAFLDLASAADASPTAQEPAQDAIDTRQV